MFRLVSCCLPTLFGVLDGTCLDCVCFECLLFEFFELFFFDFFSAFFSFFTFFPFFPFLPFLLLACVCASSRLSSRTLNFFSIAGSKTCFVGVHVAHTVVYAYVVKTVRDWSVWDRNDALRVVEPQHIWGRARQHTNEQKG